MPKFPGLLRKNNVPEWQRLHQNHDGLRQWQKVRTRWGTWVERMKVAAWHAEQHRAQETAIWGRSAYKRPHTAM